MRHYRRLSPQDTMRIGSIVCDVTQLRLILVRAGTLSGTRTKSSAGEAGKTEGYHEQRERAVEQISGDPMILAPPYTCAPAALGNGIFRKCRPPYR
ncbi:hypothetical protein C8Q77DRAFT_237871 [Trametes polyzona]|nr:hypothetical protein C8Q77DRAFT_237871 [Trametes polyzona]